MKIYPNFATQFFKNALLFNKSHMLNKINQIKVRQLFIQTQETPNPLTLKFLPGQKILSEPNRTYDMADLQNARKSPLAMHLMRIPGVKSVFFGEDFVTITKQNEDEDWAVIKPDVFATLMDFLQSGKPIFTDESTLSKVKDTTILPGDDEIIAMIKELLETRIKPMVQEDGGDILFVKFEDGILKLKLQGSCTGCPSSSVTLKMGIKNMMQFYVPEVKDVIEVMDETDKLVEDEFSKFELKRPKK